MIIVQYPLTVNMHALKRVFRRLLGAFEAALTWLYGWRWNPLHQSGTVSVLMLLVLLVTGLYLVLFYRVGAPAESVARIAADPWLGSWIRTLHRYATDVFVVASVVHAVKMFSNDRSWGPRTLAWVSGIALFAIGMILAWTGFVLAWDSFGERLAREGGRLLDVLPVFSEPVSRIFAGDGPVPNAFFFVNLFIHIALPLGMGVAFWLHLSRLARPAIIPPRALAWGMVAALTSISVVRPAPLGPAADPLTLTTSTPVDMVVAWWLPLTERLAPGVVWSLVVVIAVAALLVPRLTRRARVGSWAPSVVDPRLCTGCNQCPQDCPWDAITMVARDDDRGTLVARVDPALCVSCGICAGSCAPMGVGPGGRTGRDQLQALRSGTLPLLHQSNEHPIVVVSCMQAPESHREALRALGAQLHPVSCVGNLHTSAVELLIRNGAAGVIVFGCPPRDCVGREGPRWLYERMFNDREAELQPRVDRRRVQVATMAAGDREATLAAYRSFAASVAGLDAPSAPGVDETDALSDPDLYLCDTVPLAERLS